MTEPLSSAACACGGVSGEPCPWGIRLHAHCVLCGRCTRLDDGTQRSCNGASRAVKRVRHGHFVRWQTAEGES